MELDGRKIFVREDRGSQPPKEKAERETAGKDDSDDATPKKERNFQSDGVQATSGRVYVGNLAWSVDWRQLVDHFKTCGKVIFAEILTDIRDRSMGCAIVMYKT